MTHINIDLLSPGRSTRCGMAATGFSRHVRQALGGVLALLLAGATGWAAAQDAPQKLRSIRLTAGMHLINAEVAQNSAERQIGLMNRPVMATHDGMLFIFETQEVHCFWMKNTLLPLSIAFLADDGSIVNIADMQPQSEVSHCPKKAVRYALEMNQGWFAKRGLGAGSKIGGGPFKP